MVEAERMWIRYSQDELKSSKHYKDLAVKLKLMDSKRQTGMFRVAEEN